ncbi:MULTISPECIES: TPM domain-containing protein [Burkholderia]|uniref:TPM domain-containing protein n=1 Tax=Burkholderia TaxID=32008 RepID=UPI0015C587D0|nr:MULTISPECIES: TPM domain-containing protein [Burkholderia]MBY4724340.1 TPM domain-containing protein [Burkholderia contaminans]MCI3969799.1 TPM domain-containing protein [Burkholderia sp. HI4860]MDN7787740.1 TPM domain-containing protein [Burkholderia contaminans]
MNLKRQTGRPCPPDGEGDPGSSAGTTRNDAPPARARSTAGLGGNAKSAAAAVLAGIALVHGAAFAAPTGDDAANASTASVPFAEVSSACAHVAAATTYPIAAKPESPPRLQGRVTDTAGALSAACAAELTDRLADLERRLGVQMAVLLVGSTGQSTIEQFATDVFDKWRLGESKIDNGMLLVAALNDRTVRIEVGYGLEGAVPDIVAGRIIRERIVPAFRENRIEAGVSDALDALVREMTPPETPAQQNDVAGNLDASGAERRQSNGLPEKEPIDHGSFTFWLLLALANLALGVAAEWRKLRWQVTVPVSYLVATIVPIVMLPVGAIFEGSLEAILGALMLVPTSIGAGACLLGIGVVRSARIRKYTAIIGGTLAVLIAIGHAMGYSPGEVLLTVFCVLMVIGIILDKLFGWSGSSSSSSSSGFKWPSSNSRSGSSSDSFRGGGGSSGGGGASGRW